MSRGMSPIARGLLLAAVATPMLSGCVIYARDGGEDVKVTVGSTTTTVGDAETLRSVRFENGALIARVDSNGCTQASDFAVAVTDGTPVELTLTRASQDLCKALVPEGVELRWTYEELGVATGSAVRVINPVRL